MTNALEVINVNRSFGDKIALQNLSFIVKPGEIKGLLGPNGSGKSTSMKICAGIIKPTFGNVLINQYSLETQALEAKSSLGYVPDVGGLFPRLTGWEHLELNAKLRGLKKWETGAKSLIEDLDLTDAINKKTTVYSHGMARRLSTIIALTSSPALILLDEPFDGVDPAGTEIITQMVKSKADQGVGILVTTHLMDIAENLCDEVLILNKGAVQYIWNTENKEDLKSLFTNLIKTNNIKAADLTKTPLN